MEPSQEDATGPGREGEGQAALKMAALKQHLALLRSPSPAQRIQGAKAIGELGQEGESARRELCKAMLDTSEGVVKAAGDALMKVDPVMGDLALSIFINVNVDAVVKAGQLQGAGEPLTPLVLELARRLRSCRLGRGQIGRPTRPPLPDCLITLSRIAPQDDAANRLVGELILFDFAPYERMWGRGSSASVRGAAIVAMRGMRDAKLALKPLLTILRTDNGENTQMEVLRSLEAIYDAKNGKAIRQALESLRFAKSEVVRKAVQDLMVRFKD
jgi:hypothetical protein